MKQGIIYRAETGTFRYAGWPTLAKDENGVLYAACSGHRLSHICPFGKDYLFTSIDDGKSWSMPMIANDTDLDDRDAGLCPLGDGKILLTYFNHTRDFYIDRADEFIKHFCDESLAGVQRELYMGAIDYLKKMPEERNTYGSFIRISEDGGRSFGKAIKVPVTSPHGPTKLSDGRLLYFGKERGSGVPERKDKILAYDSLDGGLSWNYLATVDLPDGCTEDNVHEPYALELPDGRIIGAIRGQGEPVAHNFSIYLCFSDDGGRSWSHPEPTGISGSPPHLMLHSSGALVMTYGRREEPYGECARVSYDGGKSFGKEIVLRGAKDSDLGYPSTVELSDGSLLTAYYQKYGDDGYCSLLSTEWSLTENE